MERIEKYIVSRTAGRMRLRIAELKSAATAEAACAALRDVAGVTSVEVNPVTGSVLVRFDKEVFDEKEFASVVDKAFPKGINPVEKPIHLPKVNLKSKKVRLFENRTMLVLGAVSLASLVFKSTKVHTIAGFGFAAASALHTWRYRKNLVK